MRKLVWFTHTNVSPKNRQDLSFDLTRFLDVFIKNKLWNKKPYRDEYKEKFARDDLNKIITIKINIHTNGAPYSNVHSYENTTISNLIRYNEKFEFLIKIKEKDNLCKLAA